MMLVRFYLKILKFIYVIHTYIYTYVYIFIHFTDDFIFELYIFIIKVYLSLFYIIFNKDISIIIEQQKFG